MFATAMYVFDSNARTCRTQTTMMKPAGEIWSYASGGSTGLSPLARFPMESQAADLQVAKNHGRKDPRFKRLNQTSGRTTLRVYIWSETCCTVQHDMFLKHVTMGSVRHVSQHVSTFGL